MLDKTAIKKRGGKANDLDETMQSECVQCLRVLMNTEVSSLLYFLGQGYQCTQGIDISFILISIACL